LLEAEDAGKQFYDALREDVLQQLIDREVARQQAEKKGYFKYTDAHRTEAKQATDEYIAQQITKVEQRIKDSLKGQNYEGDLRQMATEQFWSESKADGITYDTILNDKLEELALDRYFTDNIKVEPVTDGQVEAEYNRLAEVQQDTYAKDISRYQEDYKAGKVICYNLADYARIKYILIALPPEDIGEIETLTVEADDEFEEKKQENPKLTEPKYSVKYKEAIAYRTKALKKIENKASQVLKLIKDGKDFDEIMLQYNEDVLFYEPIYGEKGYLLNKSAIKDPKYLDVIAGLNNGEVALAQCNEGYQIIQLIENVPTGKVPFETVKNDLRAQMMKDKREKAIKAFCAKLSEGVKPEKIPENYNSITYTPKTQE
jgi:predicted RNA-binding protein with EMAP domain